MAEQIPTTYLGLFIALMLGMWTLIGVMVRSILGNQAALGLTLENHLSSIERGLGIALDRAEKLQQSLDGHATEERAIWKDLGDHERELWRALLDRVSPVKGAE